MGAIFQLARLLHYQAKIRLVYQFGASQGMIRTFGPQMAVSDAPEFLIYQGHQNF